MYTIKEAAARTGIPIALLRAWERRYGVVTPVRTASGYRLYDDAAVARLRTMRRLVADGWTPSSAAAALASGQVAVLTPVTDKPEPAARDGRVSPGRATSDEEAGVLSEQFLEAAAALDQAGLEEALDAMLASGTFETVADRLLLPTLTMLGDRWADGRIGVAGEHAASHSVLRRLSAAFQAAGRPAGRDRPILIGLPPGSRHELGALTFAIAARRAGLPILYLGPDLPVDEWAATAFRTRARAAVIGVLTANDVRGATDVATALLELDPPVTTLFGGRRAPLAGQSMAGAAVADPARASFPDAAPGRRPIVLPDPLVEAVAALEAAVRSSA